MNTHDWLGLAFGLVIGVSLGLTGGGGSIFALPLLICGLGLPPRSAVAVSLAAVGVTAGFGAAMQLKAREIEILPGFIFAIGGMLFAPLGAWLGHFIPAGILLSVFALLMGFVAWRIWHSAAQRETATGPCVSRGAAKLGAGCNVRLTSAGAVAGLLSGLFGVGGGFVVVPALLYVTGTSIHRAVATSLMVIFLISISGAAANVLQQPQPFPMPASALFVIGGFAGMFFGSGLRERFSGPALRKTFASAMWLISAYMLAKNLGW